MFRLLFKFFPITAVAEFNVCSYVDSVNNPITFGSEADVVTK